MPDPVRGEPEPTPDPEDHSHDLPPVSPAELPPSDAIPAELVPSDPAPADLTPSDAIPAPDYDEHGTPSLDYVRDKIEGRYATSLGAGELAGDTDRAREQEEEMAERDRKAADRLAEIRRSLG